MNRSVASSLASLAVSALVIHVATSSADAQSSCTGCCQAPSLSYDSLISDSSVVPGFIDRFGVDDSCSWLEEMCYPNAPGGTSLTDPNGAMRRLLNAIALSDRVFRPDGRSWADYLDDETGAIEPWNLSCTNPGGAMKVVACEQPCTVHVSLRSHRGISVALRASQLMHEARHCSDWDMCSRHPHVDGCTAGPGNCDQRFSDNLAYTYSVRFLESFVNQAFGTFPEPALRDAVEDANRYLDNNFVEDPGTRLELEMQPTGSAHWLWPGEATTATVLPNVDDSPPPFFQRIAITYDAVHEAGVVRVVLRGVGYDRVAFDPIEGTSTWSSSGFKGTVGAHWVTVDATTVHPDAVITAMLLAWEPNGARPDGERLRVTAAAGRRHPDGAIDPSDLIVHGGFMDTTEADVAFVAPEDHALHGFGVRRSPAGTSLWPTIERHQAVRLTPPYTEPVGARSTLVVHAANFARHLECPEDYVPVGMLAGSIQPNERVRAFGLMCAPLNLVRDAQPVSAELALAHLPVATLPGPHTYGEAGIESVRTSFGDGEIARCPDGWMLRDFLGYAVPWDAPWAFAMGIRCRPFPYGVADTTPGSNVVTYVPLGLGTTAPLGGHLALQRCPGGYLDRLYLHHWSPTGMYPFSMTAHCAPTAPLLGSPE